MKLIKNSMIMMAVAVGGLSFSAGTAQAGPISISFTTTGTFSAGTPPELSYTPTSFTGTTSASGFLLLPDIGQFDLNALADPQHFNGESFTLHVNFLEPLGVTGSVDFVASLSGHINGNGNGNVHVNFTPNSQLVAYSNSTGSGTFSLAVNDVTGLQPGGTATATASIANAGDPTSVTPEPGSFILFGSALLGLSCIVRRSASRRVLAACDADKTPECNGGQVTGH